MSEVFVNGVLSKSKLYVEYDNSSIKKLNH